LPGLSGASGEVACVLVKYRTFGRKANASRESVENPRHRQQRTQRTYHDPSDTPGSSTSRLGFSF
jgi:hypothetical protein